MCSGKHVAGGSYLKQNLEELLFRVFVAYRKGLFYQRPPTYFRKRDWRKFLWMRITDRIPLPQRLLIRKSWQGYNQGLRASQQNRLDEAEGIFQATRSFMENQQMDRETTLLCRFGFEAAHAYLDYRKSQFENARRRVALALDMDLELEEDFGYNIMQIHRLQLGYNQMKVDLVEGNTARALALGGEMISYIEGTATSLSLHHSWNYDRFLSLPQYLRHGMSPQVGNDAALSLMGVCDLNLWRVFFENAAIPDSWVNGEPRTTTWIRVKAAFLTKPEEDYLQILATYLEAGYADVPPQWYAALVDFIEFCDRREEPVAHEIQDLLRADAQHWGHMPKTLSQRLANNQNLISVPDGS